MATDLFSCLPKVVHRYRPELCRKINFLSDPSHPRLVKLVSFLVGDTHHSLSAHLYSQHAHNGADKLHSSSHPSTSSVLRVLDNQSDNSVLIKAGMKSALTINMNTS